MVYWSRFSPAGDEGDAFTAFGAEDRSYSKSELLFFFVFFVWSWCILTSQVEVFVFHQAHKKGVSISRQYVTNRPAAENTNHQRTNAHHDRDIKAKTGGYRPHKAAHEFEFMCEFDFR